MPRLTKQVIEKTPSPSSGQSFYWDSEVKGFGIRVTANAKAFILDRKLNGRSVRITIGRCDVWSEENARKEAKRLTVEIDRGIDPRAVLKKTLH